MTTTREAALEVALKLARNRLQACAIDHPTGSREMAERSEWADEATASLSTPATEPQGCVEGQDINDAICAALGDAMDCTRVWEAWHYGTMSDEDFVLVRDDAARVDEIVEAINKALAARPAPQHAPHCEYCDGTGDVHRADGEWLGNCYACNFHRAPQPAADTRVVGYELSMNDEGGIYLKDRPDAGLVAIAVRDPEMPWRRNHPEAVDAIIARSAIIGNATPAPSNKIAESARVLLDATPNPVFDMLKPVLMGEFSQSMGGTDEDGNEVTHKIAISWTVTKEIIAAALRALAGKGLEA